MNTIEKWSGMAPEAQYEALAKMCRYTQRFAVRHRQSWSAWMATEDDLQTAVAEAWLEMSERQSKSRKTFERSIFNSCVVSIHREGRKAARAEHMVSITGEETEDSTPGAFADWLTEQSAESTRKSDPFDLVSAAEIREQLAGDETDKVIISGLVIGLTLREIAEQAKMSHQAVSKRLNKIRARAAFE